MYGYVRPVLKELPQEEQDRFRRVYCGLCHTLGKRHGLAARFILNYDFTFLAILLSEPEESQCLHCFCPANPCRKREALAQTPALELAADESVILAYWQLRDGVADHGFWTGLKYRLAARLLRRAYRRAAAWRPEFDQAARCQLETLAELEQQRCASIDRPADAFAQLLAAAAKEAEEGPRRRVLREILYHLGRWIYLADAADDLAKDVARGNYNPLRYRFSCQGGVLDEEEKRQLALTMDHSVHLIESAYELWNFGCWDPILRSTFYMGLFSVAKAVLEGEFQTSKSCKDRKTKIGEESK